MKLFSISSRDKDPTYSGYAQYAALFAMYPFITYFNLFDVSSEALTPKIFGHVPTVPGVQASGPDEETILVIAFAFLLLGVLPGVVNSLWRRRWGWLFVGMAAVYGTIAETAQNIDLIDFGDWDELVTFLPMIGAKISFVWIALRGRIFSRSFLVFCVTSAILTSVLAQTTGYEILDMLRQILPLLAFMTAVALFRLVVTAIYQNAYFIRKLGFWRTTKTLFRTTALWAPILVFAVPYFAGTAALEKAIEDGAYANRMILVFPMDSEIAPGCGYLMGSAKYRKHLEDEQRKVRRWSTIEAGSLRSTVYIKDVRAGLVGLIEARIFEPKGFLAASDTYALENWIKGPVLDYFDRETKNVGLAGLEKALTKVRSLVASHATNDGFVQTPGLYEPSRPIFKAILNRLDYEIFAAGYDAERRVSSVRTDRRIQVEDARPGNIAHYRSRGTNLRDNVMFTIHQFHECQLEKWIETTTDFEDQVKGAPYYRLSDEFETVYDLAIEKHIPMEPPNFSGFLSGAKNWSVNEMQDQINTAYSFVRNSAKQNLVDMINDTIEPKIEKGLIKIGDAAAKLRDDVAPHIRQSSIATQTAVWWMFSYWHALHTLAHLLFAILCVKSFMYVFGRVAFAKETGVFLTLGDPENPTDMPKGAITTHGQDYALGKEIEGRYFISRRIQPHGMPPRFAIPQPLGAPIARLLHRSMTMNRFDLTAGGESVHFTATGGKTFVEWDLKEGEVVVFDFTDFVGMSDSIKVSTLISTQVTTLLLGKFIFSTATGPGRLILLTEGRPKLGDDPEAASSMPPERLVAWQQNTRFHADSNLGLLDIYFSTAYLKKEGPGQLIMDVDRQKSRGTGLSRFILHFLWPG